MFELEIINKEKKISKGKKSTTDDIEDDASGVDGSSTLLLLKRILETVADMVDECEITANEKGLTLQVMDSMHASISDIFISHKIFDKYRCDRSLIIGIKIKDFLKILRGLKTDTASEYVFRLFAHDDSNSLGINFDCNNYELNFELTLYRLNLEKYDFQKQDYDVEVEMPTKDFLLIPKIVGTFDNHIVIEAANKTFSFRQGGERTKAVCTIKESEDVTMKINKPLKLEIAMKYVDNIAKAANLCSSVRISLGETAPVYFDFELSEGGYIRFFIAPKIEDEE